MEEDGKMSIPSVNCKVIQAEGNTINKGTEITLGLITY